MKTKLIRQKFSGNTAYKILSREWCCEQLKENPLVVPSSDYREDGKEDSIPALVLRREYTFHSYADEFTEISYFKINFCPFCGSPVSVEVAAEEDVSEEFEALSEKRKEIVRELKTNDSKKREKELLKERNHLDNQINWYFQMVSYDKKFKKDYIKS